MRGSKVKDLQSRTGNLEKTETSEWRTRAESEAYMSWIIQHLTESEQMSLARGIRDLHDGDVMGEDAKAIVALGEERAGKEPASAWETFKEKHLRAETLRHSGHRMTDDESKELAELNTWLFAETCWKQKP